MVVIIVIVIVIIVVFIVICNFSIIFRIRTISVIVIIKLSF